MNHLSSVKRSIQRSPSKIAKTARNLSSGARKVASKTKGHVIHAFRRQNVQVEIPSVAGDVNMESKVSSTLADRIFDQAQKTHSRAAASRSTSAPATPQRRRAEELAPFNETRYGDHLSEVLDALEYEVRHVGLAKEMKSAPKAAAAAPGFVMQPAIDTEQEAAETVLSIINADIQAVPAAVMAKEEAVAPSNKDAQRPLKLPVFRRPVPPTAQQQLDRSAAELLDLFVDLAARPAVLATESGSAQDAPRSLIAEKAALLKEASYGDQLSDVLDELARDVYDERHAGMADNMQSVPKTVVAVPGFMMQPSVDTEQEAAEAMVSIINSDGPVTAAPVKVQEKSVASVNLDAQQPLKAPVFRRPVQPLVSEAVALPTEAVIESTR